MGTSRTQIAGEGLVLRLIAAETCAGDATTGRGGDPAAPTPEMVGPVGGMGGSPPVGLLTSPSWTADGKATATAFQSDCVPGNWSSMKWNGECIASRC